MSEQDIEIEKEEEPEEHVITAKKVSDLTQEDRDYLLNCAKNGIENDHFEVKIFKNGNHKIVLRKPPKKSIAQKTIENKSAVMTNDQLLMEHVIDLESRFKAIEIKHKKLKKKYKNLKQDLYIDAEEENPPVEEVKKEEKKPAETFVEKLKEAQEEVQAVPSYMRQPQMRGWRSRVSNR